MVKGKRERAENRMNIGNKQGRVSERASGREWEERNRRPWTAAAVGIATFRSTRFSVPLAALSLSLSSFKPFLSPRARCAREPSFFDRPKPTFRRLRLRSLPLFTSFSLESLDGSMAIIRYICVYIYIKVFLLSASYSRWCRAEVLSIGRFDAR